MYNTKTHEISIIVFNDNDDDVTSNNLNNRNKDQKMIAIVTIKSVYFTEIYMHVRKTKELVNTATVTSCG